MQQLTFYIIYTPGTVKYLRLFTLSLLKWVNCSFRLVPNGCSDEELLMLERFCRSHARLELFPLPWETLKKHGRVLSYLQEQESSEYFCFLDSDIFASGNFLHEFSAMLPNVCVFSSGLPFWRKNEQYRWNWAQNMQMIFGENVFTQQGTALGGSYFAIYNNRVLSKCIQTAGITFKPYSWRNIPGQYQKQLREAGLKAQGYDTGKLLNILLHLQGEELLHKESAFLHHIGGFSYFKHPGDSEGGIKPSNIDMVKKPIRKLRDFCFFYGDMRHRQENNRIKQGCKIYFTQLIENLFEAQALPQPYQNSEHPEIQYDVSILKDRIIKLYEEFKEQL